MKANPALTPLTFEPVFMERVWGGRRLESEFGKKLPTQKPIGESWEIADRPEAQSIVRNGTLRGKPLHELWSQDRDEIFGHVPDAPRFPLLLKVLDAHDKLSLQVHPPQEIASTLGGEPKTEFWYVAAADPGAELYLGFREAITRKQFEKALRDGTAPVIPGAATNLHPMEGELIKQVIEHHLATARHDAFALLGGRDPVTNAAIAIGPIDGVNADGSAEFPVHPDPGLGTEIGVRLRL